MKRQFAFGSLASLAVGGLAMQAHAILLSDLVANNGQVVSGDKVFTDFEAIPTGFGTFQANPALIDVVPITDSFGNFGIRFQPASSTFGSILSAGPGSFADLVVAFTVTPARPMLISDLHLVFEATAPDDGHAQVVEQARDPGQPDVVAQLQVDEPGSSSAMVLFDDPHASLRIVKDMAVIGGSSLGSSIQTVDQTFSQVPEPTTLGLLALGSLVIFRGRRLRRSLVAATAGMAITVGVLSSPQEASAILLSTLEANAGTPAGEIQQGDKLFSNFDFNLQASAGTVFANPAAIDVSGITVAGNHGVRFAGLWAALTTNAPGSTLIATIEFDVTVTDPNFQISDIHMLFNGATTADGYARVTETVTSNGNPVGTLQVTTPNTLADDALTSGTFTTLHVTKVIELFGGSARGISTISVIDQTFSQVPEPATLGLLLGGLPLLLRRRTA